MMVMLCSSLSTSLSTRHREEEEKRGGGGRRHLQPKEVTPPWKLQWPRFWRVIGSTSRPAPLGVVGGVGRLHLTVLRTKKLKRKEKSWQEEPGELEEQR